MTTETITFKALNLNIIESRVIRPLRLSERPLETADIVRISRLPERQVRRVLARLMDLAAIDYVAGGFTPTEAGRAASLDH